MKLSPKLEQYRIRSGDYATRPGERYGAFQIPGPAGRLLLVLATDGESFKPVAGFDGLYEVSNLGRVRSLAKTVPMPHSAIRTQPQQFLSEEKMEKGYRRVTLCKGHREMDKRLVHVLVADAFIPEGKHLPEINHADGDKGNNAVWNLERCTAEYNMHHSIERGLRHGVTAEQIEQIKQLSPEEIDAQFQFHQSTIRAIRAGEHRNVNPEPPVRCDPFHIAWEHVSVSIKGNRPPNWREMCHVKDLFWAPDECVVQFHPAAADYVNNMNTCLHMWRCTAQEFPTPPPSLIGIKELGTIG